MMDTTVGVPSSRGPSCSTCRSRKVKCDREKPKCAPCRRGCLECIYSPKPGSVRSRRYWEKETRKSQLSYTHSAMSTDSLSDPGPANVNAGNERFDASNETDTDNEALPESINRVSNGLVVHFRGGHSKFFSTSSSVGQIFEIEQWLRSQAALADSKNSQSFEPHNLESLRGELFRNSLRDPVRAPVVRYYPPKADAERAMALVFRRDCTQWPLYSEKVFCKQVQAFYQTPDVEKCPATAIGLWYILSVSLHIRLSERNLQDSAARTLKRSLDEALDALQAVCANYSSTPELIKPNIIDVQALTIAAVTALHQGHNTDFRRVLEVACLLAKSIGLHQTPRQTAPGELEEDLWIFWGLYILDKMSLVVGGDSCLLPSPNCGVPFPGKPSGVSPEVHRLRMARIQLASIHEQIYSNLYSVEASRRAPQQRQHSITAAAADLQRWASSYLSSHAPPHAPDDASMYSVLHSQTQYLHKHALCLVWRASVDPADEKKLIEVAREGSALVLGHLSEPGSGHIGQRAGELFSLLNASAAAPVLTLFKFVMCSTEPDRMNDACLLKQVLENILKCVKYTGIAAETSDIAHIAAALGRELDWKMSEAGLTSPLSPIYVNMPWVSSIFAHITEADLALNADIIAATHTSGPPFGVNDAVVTLDQSFPSGTALSNSVDGAGYPSQRSSLSGENGLLPSPTSLSSRDMLTMPPGSRVYTNFGSAFRNGLMTSMGHGGPLENGLPAEVDWASFNVQ